MASKDPILARAAFDRRLPTYCMLQAQALLLFAIITIPLMPVWFLLGRALYRRQYENLACELTTRSLNVRRGVLFKVQQTIPLDKITDLAVLEGPFLRYLGLGSLRIETAGGGQATTTGQALLSGIVDPEGFRDLVLEQRDAVVLGGDGGSTLARRASRESSAEDPGGALGSEAVLLEIRDALHRIEQQLGERVP